MWSIFNNYYDYSTTTSVTMEYKHLPLPSITICNVNPVRHTSFANHSEEWVRDEYAKMSVYNEVGAYIAIIVKTLCVVLNRTLCRYNDVNVSCSQ